MLRKIVLTILTVTTAFLANAQLARMQFANNSPDVSLPAIDIYVNGTLLVPNIGFRSASTFVDVLPGNTTIAIAPQNSLSVNDAFYSTTITLSPQDTIVAVACGTRTSLGYSPYVPFGLSMYFGAHELGSDPLKAELLFSNGSTDASIIDVRSGLSTWINNLGVGNIKAYRDYVDGNTYVFRVTNAVGNHVFNTYTVTPQPFWLGQTGMMLMSGFVDPNSNNNGPALGAFVFFSNGGNFISISTTTAEIYARAQIIHNSADSLIDTVDVYMNNELILDDMPYLTTTEFVDAPADIPVEIGIAPMNSSSVSDTFYNLSTSFNAGGSYVLAAQGIESASGYNPAPAFHLKVFASAKETSTSGNTDILFNSGCTDMPGVDIMKGTTAWVSDLYYGDFSTSYITVPNIDTVVDLQNSNTSILIDKYKVQLQTLGFAGKAVTLVASGFRSPVNNSNGHPYGLYFTPLEGGELIPLPLQPIIVGIQPSEKDIQFSIAPNPATDLLRITSQKAAGNLHVAIYDLAGKEILTITNLEKNTIDISQLAKGVYLLKIEMNGLQEYQKFIKQ